MTDHLTAMLITFAPAFVFIWIASHQSRPDEDGNPRNGFMAVFATASGLLFLGLFLVLASDLGRVFG